MRARETREAPTERDAALQPTSVSPLGGVATLTICVREENQWVELDLFQRVQCIVNHQFHTLTDIKHTHQVFRNCYQQCNRFLCLKLET